MASPDTGRQTLKNQCFTRIRGRWEVQHLSAGGSAKCGSTAALLSSPSPPSHCRLRNLLTQQRQSPNPNHPTTDTLQILELGTLEQRKAKVEEPEGCSEGNGETPQVCPARCCRKDTRLTV